MPLFARAWAFMASQVASADTHSATDLGLTTCGPGHCFTSRVAAMCRVQLIADAMALP